MKVLLVEDNELNRDMLARRLSRKGFQVTCAVDGEDGVRQAIERDPDVVLMDISLPVIDGWEAMRRIRCHPSTADTPIVALTAHVFPEDRERAASSGCAAFVGKPINLAELVETLQRVGRRGAGV